MLSLRGYQGENYIPNFSKKKATAAAATTTTTTEKNMAREEDVEENGRGRKLNAAAKFQQRCIWSCQAMQRLTETKEPDPRLFWLLLSHTTLVQMLEDMC